MISTDGRGERRRRRQEKKKEEKKREKKKSDGGAGTLGFTLGAVALFIAAAGGVGNSCSLDIAACQYLFRKNFQHVSRKSNVF